MTSVSSTAKVAKRSTRAHKGIVPRTAPRLSRAKPVESAALPAADHVGWAEFNRGGGAFIKAVDISGRAKTVGPSVSTPVLRLRPASRFPKTVSKIRAEHNMLFDTYKTNGRQVRTIVAMGVPVLIHTGNHAVVVDRPPGFESALIQSELSRQRSAVALEMIHAMIPILENLLRKRKRPISKNKSNQAAQQALLQPQRENMTAYEMFYSGAKQVRPVLPTGLFKLIETFMSDRSAAVHHAERTRLLEGDLDKYEVD